jgi:RNA polymerase sigma-70 factor, ECF subfamily
MIMGSGPHSGWVMSGGPPQRDGDSPARLEAERQLVAALRRGEEQAFADLVDRHTSALLRVARSYVSSVAVAEEVVQETWLALLNGIDRFEERSSIKTWLFRVAANIARTRGAQERRTVPFSSLGVGEDEESGPTVDPARFRGQDDPWPHHWSSPPQPWDEVPEQRLLSHETRKHLQEAFAELPERQRAVVTLRDVQGFSAEDVCRLLELTAPNQRVLLHRGRARLRQSLEAYLGEPS